MKYRLKKDLPDMEAGEIFDDTDSFGHETSSMFDSRGAYRFEKDDIKHFDEWFEEVSDKWPQYGDKYYYLDSVGEVSPQVVFSYTYAAEGRRKLGNTFKTRSAICQFARFLKAMEVIRHDEGFMKKGDDDDIWAVVYDSNNELTTRSVYGTFKEFAGMVYFDTEEHAIISINEHPFEWHDILRHDWSKGEDEEDED